MKNKNKIKNKNFKLKTIESKIKKFWKKQKNIHIRNPELPKIYPTDKGREPAQRERHEREMKDRAIRGCLARKRQVTRLKTNQIEKPPSSKIMHQTSARSGRWLETAILHLTTTEGFGKNFFCS
ncbi:unnamed protein product [Meloidogyne enterolobii]|uniref:Uncharacterized protein n=1 Tax=Meloidogyne enterolobii TaxID=390850 RepID=A0ACB0ZEJ6_MELEN